MLVIGRTICIGISSFLLLQEVINEKLKLKINMTFFAVYIISFYIVDTYLQAFIADPLKTIITAVILSLCCFKLCKEKLEYMLLRVIMTIAITYLILIICAFIVGIILLFVFNIDGQSFTGTIAVYMLEVFIVAILCRNKVFIPINFHRGFSYICFIAAWSALVIYALVKVQSSNYGRYLLIMGSFTILLCIYFLQERERKIQLNDLAQKQIITRQNSDLIAINETHDFLAARVHKDNKSITAICGAVQSLAEQTKDLEIKGKALKFLTEVYEMRRENEAEEEKYDHVQTTDILILDAIIACLGKVAKQNEIEFSVNINDKPTFILNKISSEKLKTLVADLIENAIIAVKGIKSQRKISLCFNMVGGVYQFIILDNGIPFQKQVLQTIGKQKITTHKDSGGSGIGYMTVFEILENSKASLRITENIEVNGLNYKEIKIRFDDKQEFLVNYDKESADGK